MNISFQAQLDRLKKLLSFESYSFDLDLASDAGEEIVESIVDSISGFVQGTEADVRIFGMAIARDMVTALTIRDDERRNKVLNECYAQLRVLGETSRIRVWNVSHEIFWGNMLRILNIVASALGARIA